MNMRAGVAVLAAAAFGGLGAVPARADINHPALNGTYTATSNGEWARTNDSYHDEQSVRSTWTIASTCQNPVYCSGTVTSSQGWTAKINRVPGMWKVIRELPGWETCGDGTAATGRQVFTFVPYGNDPLNPVDPNSDTLVGDDVTTGPSGACGQSTWLDVAMPFKLVKIA